MVVSTRGAVAQAAPQGSNASQASANANARNAPAQAPSVHSKPEEEPDAAQENAKPSLKIDLKNIKVTPFDGAVKTGSFDANAREFRMELAEQIEDAQVLAGQTWSDSVKKVVFKTFLTGMARRWYSDWAIHNPEASFVDACDALEHAFRPVLLSTDIIGRIKSERKRWNESYRDYADRLMQMADAIEGGNRAPANARHALIAFVRNAYPKWSDFVETKIDLTSPNPDAELKHAVEVLTQKAQTDGRLPERKPRSDDASKRAKPKQVTASRGSQSTTKPKTNQNTNKGKKRAAPAEANVVERKKKPKVANTSGSSKGDFVCYDCGGKGHTARYCRKYLQGNGNNDDAEAKEGSAQLAEADSEADESDD